MFLRELVIENFKGYKGEHTAIFDNNLSFFVGDNNSGKSTMFEAVDFLKNGLPTSKNTKDILNKGSDSFAVTAKFKGNIKDVITDFSQSKYHAYVFEEDGIETLLARRSSKTEKIKQNGRDVELNIKKITLWNSSTNQYENPSGFDSVFKTLFEAQFVWADTNPDDISDFGSTKICGRLLTAAVGDFFTTPQWETFTRTHQETFHDGSDSLASRTKELEEKIQTILNDQHGTAAVTFNFQLPDPSSFIKSGGINIDDGSSDTSSKQKGTGMQRALALALIQLYADELRKHPSDPLKKKPLFLFIDEPETFLHPTAQSKFLEALNLISSTQQVFVTTHSPYLLKSFDKSNHSLFIFERTPTTKQFSSSSALGLFGTSSPTWGEINYFAYDMASVEFHNELYGFIQAKAITTDVDNEKEPHFDNYLVSQGLIKSKPWIRERGGVALPAEDKTLQTYIRNYIHHPENTSNTRYTDEELKQSIHEMIPLV